MVKCQCSVGKIECEGYLMESSGLRLLETPFHYISASISHDGGFPLAHEGEKRFIFLENTEILWH